MAVSKGFRDQFLSWAVARGCILSPQITIKDSTLGGSGVFLSLRSVDLIDLKDIKGLEVMRIPKALTLSLDSFAEKFLLPQQRFDDSLQADVLRQSDIMVKFLSVFGETFNDQIDPYVKNGLTETNILVGQVQMLLILRQIRNRLDGKNDTLKGSPFAALDEFWKLLENTDVPSLSVDEFYDKFLDLYKYNVREYRQRIRRLRYDAIYSALDSIDLGVDYKEFVNDDYLKRIELSVISRLLEIPEKLPPKESEEREGRYDKINELNLSTDPDAPTNQEDDVDDGEKSLKYGFAVSSTLVPVVDFVNHSNDYMNSFFDVDPDTGDVLLRILNEKIEAISGAEAEEIELLIRYSDYEDTLKFAYAYGFIPKSHVVQPLFEHAISRDYLNQYVVKSTVEGEEYEHNLGLFLKWIGVQPNAQFVLGYDSRGKLLDVKMNLDENLIVFGFLKGLKYFHDAALTIVGYYSELQEPEYIRELLELEESDENDIIGGYDILPYTSIYVDGEVTINEIIQNVPDQEVDRLMLEFLAFFYKYAKTRVGILDVALKEMSSGKDSSTVYDFTSLERNVLLKFCEQYDAIKEESRLDLIIGAEECDDEWLQHRIRPRTVAGEKRAALYNKYAAHDIQKLRIDT